MIFHSLWMASPGDSARVLNKAIAFETCCTTGAGIAGSEASLVLFSQQALTVVNHFGNNFALFIKAVADVHGKNDGFFI